MAIEALEGKDTNVYSRKGVFIPDITVEMFRNASLEGVEELMASGEMEDISLPSAQPERPKGEWITDDLSGIIYCSRCGNAAPMETTGGRQYKSKFCQTCGADMRGEQDDEQASTIDVEEALNMAINVLTTQPEITDEQAIEHLQETGWMQNHDKQMYEMGLREQLADDSDSYDALLPSAQPDLQQTCNKLATDCISRQAAISLPVKPKEDRYFQTQNLDDAYDYGWRDLQRCIEKLPPAQQGRETGAWIAVDYFAEGKPVYREWKCSKCGCVVEDEKPTWNFCPMCGKDMRGEQNGK